MTEYQMKMEKVKKTATTLPKFSLTDADRDDDFDGEPSHSSGHSSSHYSSSREYSGRNRF